MTLAPKTSVGARPHRVRFQNPGPAVPDGDGGYTQSWVDLNPPALWVEITPATAQSLEQLAAGTVIASATHVIKGQWHQGVTPETRVLFGGREFHVAGVANLDERGIEMILLCTEKLP